MGYIIYNGKSSKEVGLEVETFPAYTSPKRSYEKVTVPGRSGDLIIDNGSWENVVRTYSVSVGSRHRDYTEMVNKISEWLHSSFNYCRLEDSYEPEYYRLAAFLDEIEFSNIYNQGAQAELSFDCKPQRFLKVGDDPIVITSKTLIYNPTSFESSPIITVYGKGAGSVTVGQTTVMISDIKTTLILDCEIDDAYYNTENRNSTISVEHGFPKISPGGVEIGFSGGVTKVEVIPKWFTI